MKKQKSNITLLQGDCLELMGDIPDGSIDCVITDPPYGVTQCKWDTVIPFEPMWAHLKRLIKPKAAIVLFGSQPFTSALIMSKPDWFRYCWYWLKNTPTGFLNAQKMPMKNIEDVIIFGDSLPVYYPQGLIPFNAPAKRGSKGSCYGESKLDLFQESTNYPRQLIDTNTSTDFKHPTQKPVALIAYLIKTYTKEGETVLDFTMGSGTTGVACKQLGRHFIGIEKDSEYFKIAKKRISEPVQVPLFK